MAQNPRLLVDAVLDFDHDSLEIVERLDRLFGGNELLVREPEAYHDRKPKAVKDRHKHLDAVGDVVVFLAHLICTEPVICVGGIIGLRASAELGSTIQVDSSTTSKTLKGIIAANSS